MPKIDSTRIDALRPRPKPSANLPYTTSTHSEDATDVMEMDKVPMGRTLRKRKEKFSKHLKRGVNEKEMENFLKRVLRIPLEKPFEEAYFTHRLWMFFRETKETQEDIRRMFHEVREKMKNMITLKKKSDPGKFAIPCLVKGLKVESSQESFTFVDCSQRNSGGIVRDLEVQIGEVCNMQTNQLCLTLIDPHAYYDPIPGMKPHTSSRRIDNPGLIAACLCGAEYETEYSASIETHTATSIDIATTEAHDEDYMEERAIEYHALCSEEDRLLHHSYRNAPSIDRGYKPSIDTHHHQTNRGRESTDAAYHTSIDNGVDLAREGNYLIESWVDDHYHESFSVETAISQPRADELHEGFTTEELLNMQERDEEDQHQAEACGEGTRFSRLLTRANCPSIDINIPSSIDSHPKPPSTVSEKAKHYNDHLTHDEFGIFRDPDGYARVMDGHALKVSREDIADILQMANGAENLFVQRRKTPEHQKRVPTTSYNTSAKSEDRGELVPKVTSDRMSHGKEISDNAYATLIRNQLQLESLGDRLQSIENATATMHDKWRRGDEAMRDFTEEKEPREEDKEPGEEHKESGEGVELESRRNDEQAEETGETQAARQHQTESHAGIPHAEVTPVEGPTIPAIGESAEADADSVEATDVDALKELEGRLMNAIRDGLKEVNKKFESLGNQLTLLEKEVMSLAMSVPDAAGVLDIAKQMQSEHGEGNDEEDGSL
ncbi:hypothetical protein F2Q68_00039123 [Brassica cretica]|uniref:Uncharacterized protein n=1 Tax=Brassica cretica TaxID=69181 RepID=A0A8S9MMK5_BRACR|nr:hypothetical protein F2Q68_00039123 [Brassica cretica]